MIKTILQITAFFFPKPFNIWFHRLAGGMIGKSVSIDFGVLILAKKLKIQDHAKIKFGSFISIRELRLGEKSSIGYFTLIKGISDFLVSDACVIGARSIINCEETIKFEYYSGCGPGCYIYTHGSFLPVTEGYRTFFAPIVVEEKVWIQMNCKIGPGVKIGRGSILMPGTVLLESIGENRSVVGNPAKLINIPLFRTKPDGKKLDNLAIEILEKFCNWSNEFDDENWSIVNDSLIAYFKKRELKITVNDDGDIILCTQTNIPPNRMYFNLATLKTDPRHHPLKQKLEEFMRLYYGLTFLTES